MVFRIARGPGKRVDDESRRRYVRVADTEIDFERRVMLAWREGADGETVAALRKALGPHGPEYVVAWGGETADGQDIVITEVDVNNLMRTKAAIYAGFSVLLTRRRTVVRRVPSWGCGGDSSSTVVLQALPLVVIFPP